MIHKISKKPENYQNNKDFVTVDLYRTNSTKEDKPIIQRYKVPYRERMTILSLLREIYENIDPSIAFRNQQCGRGICGVCKCRIGVDEKLVFGCKTIVHPGSHIIIKSYNSDKTIRDLVTYSE